MHHQIDFGLRTHLYIVVPEEVNQTQFNLLDAEPFSHAVPLSQPEGDVRVRRNEVLVLLAESLRVEFVWIGEVPLVAVQGVCWNVDWESARYLEVRNGLQGVEVFSIVGGAFTVNINQGWVHSEGLCE